jgi:DNA-directed RNA polymerase specialized sigma24 family protein
MMTDQDADEVAQDIFVRAWQKLGTFRGESAFGTWLHRLAINVILGRRETLGIRRQRYHAGDAVPPGGRRWS